MRQLIKILSPHSKESFAYNKHNCFEEVKILDVVEIVDHQVKVLLNRFDREDQQYLDFLRKQMQNFIFQEHTFSVFNGGIQCNMCL